MRFVVYGAGAIGGVVGARLFERGHEVTLIARGAHLAAIRSNGLRLDDPDDSVVCAVPAVASPGEADISADDVVVLAMKTQDTADALVALAAVAPPDITVACAQNGVANERMVLRRFARVYGVAVLCPAQFLEPGIVQAHSSPTPGLLDIGSYPAGFDDRAEQIAAAFRESTFESVARPDIMRWKYRKLIMNLGNAVQALCGLEAGGGELLDAVTAEGEAVLDAAGIERATPDEDRERRGDHLRLRPIAGERRQGGSTWQSLARRAGAIETDYLNGEIVLLGRLHGVPAPANAVLQRLARQSSIDRRPPGSFTEDEILAMIGH